MPLLMLASRTGRDIFDREVCVLERIFSDLARSRGLKMVRAQNHTSRCVALCRTAGPAAATYPPITEINRNAMFQVGCGPMLLPAGGQRNCTGCPALGVHLGQPNFFLAPIQRHPRSARESACRLRASSSPMPWKAMPGV